MGIGERLRVNPFSCCVFAVPSVAFHVRWPGGNGILPSMFVGLAGMGAGLPCAWAWLGCVLA